MELRVKALASGSSGNAYLIQTDEAALLIEAGLPMRILDRHLRDHGVLPGRLAGILVSHEHTDHAQAAAPLAKRYHAPVVANSATLRQLGLMAGGEDPTAAPDVSPQLPSVASPRAKTSPSTAVLGAVPATQILPIGRTRRIGPFDVMSFRTSHDAVDPVGFLISCDGWSICMATDLGEASPGLREHLPLADLVIIEADYDAERLRNGYYPPDLKKRIAGRQGHLSNHQTAEILVEACQGLPPLALKSVWLAHLSMHNNTHASALSTVENALYQARVRRHIGDLQVAARDRPSLEWHAQAVQRSLF